MIAARIIVIPMENHMIAARIIVIPMRNRMIAARIIVIPMQNRYDRSPDWTFTLICGVCLNDLRRQKMTISTAGRGPPAWGRTEGPSSGYGYPVGGAPPTEYPYPLL